MLIGGRSLGPRTGESLEPRARAKPEQQPVAGRAPIPWRVLYEAGVEEEVDEEAGVMLLAETLRCFYIEDKMDILRKLRHRRLVARKAPNGIDLKPSTALRRIIGAST